MRLVRAAALIIGAFLPFSAVIATADAATVTFDWTLTGPDASLGGFEYTGGGTITATTTGTPGVDLITGISGEVNGSSVTLLAANTFEGNDNLLYPTGVTATNPTVLSGNGLAFAIGAGDIDIFSFGGNGTGNAYGEFSPGGFGVGTFSVTPVSATPLPPTWTMMVLGILGLAFFAFRAAKTSSAGLATA